MGCENNADLNGLFIKRQIDTEIIDQLLAINLRRTDEGWVAGEEGSLQPVVFTRVNFEPGMVIASDIKSFVPLPGLKKELLPGGDYEFTEW